MKTIVNIDPEIRVKVEDLLIMPKIIRVNSFTEASAKEFAKEMQDAHNTSQKIIPVIVDSYGGQVYSLLSMLAEIENSKLPVATISMGKSMSCGSALLAYGTKGYRFIDKDATIMIHPVSSFAWGKLEEMQSKVKEAERLGNLVFQKMAKKCGHKNKNYFLDLMLKHKNADLYLSARQALKHQLADHIGVPGFELNVTLDLSFNLP